MVPAYWEAALSKAATILLPLPFLSYPDHLNTDDSRIGHSPRDPLVVTPERDRAEMSRGNWSQLTEYLLTPHQHRRLTKLFICTSHLVQITYEKELYEHLKMIRVFKPARHVS